MQGQLGAAGAVDSVPAALDSEGVAGVGAEVRQHGAAAEHRLACAPLLLFLRSQPPELHDVLIGGQSVFRHTPVDQTLVIDTAAREIDHRRLGY